ncbi:ribosome maturation factor RimM [Alkalicoccus halolimnae]|uniref:Ribosome maturation factor RimM n=1 Tax=Alkalicoccus halolimnae TaxID=1667239 RepID=A0A5C7FB44_9BACI|nr:ribosome maturation factor RimM [Alkalicoccus halolimnae]TXF87363.1 ribosome maturation factor RimM [Alkalicoccus halolimnae]
MSDWLNVGEIVNTHGIRGEVRVISRTDFPENRYKTGSQLTIFQEGKPPLPVTIAGWRKHKQFDLLRFASYENVNDVEQFKGAFLKVHRSSLAEDELFEGEFYHFEIIGLEVFTVDGEKLGTVKEILTPGANDVWVIHPVNRKKELLIPYVEEVVKDIDLDKGIIVIEPMEGLLDL